MPSISSSRERSVSNIASRLPALFFFFSFLFLIKPQDANQDIYQADDEMDLPYLAGFEWNKKECWTRLIVHQKIAGPPLKSTKKNKKSKS